MTEIAPASGRAPRLDILKALGDNTRYAIYLELARSPIPLTTAEIAEMLDLHVNTVRPHLERMRDVGLLLVDTEARGGVGRPQHRYSLSAEAPSLGLEPSPFPTLARMLVRAAAAGGLDGAELREAGCEQGVADGSAWAPDSVGIEVVIGEQARLGFDPETAEADTEATIAFAHCPFRELAEQHPDLICAMHRGLVEGLVSCFGDVEVEAFHTLVDRRPCQVDLK